MAQDLSAAGAELPEIMTVGRWEIPTMPARYTHAARRGSLRTGPPRAADEVILSAVLTWRTPVRTTALTSGVGMWQTPIRVGVRGQCGDSLHQPAEA